MQANKSLLASLKAMLNGIKYQLINDYRQIAGCSRGQYYFWPIKALLQLKIPSNHIGSHCIKDISRYLHNTNFFRILLRQKFVNHGHTENPIGAFLQGRLYLWHFGTAGLQPQKAGYGLEIIFDTMMNLLNNSRFYLYLPLLFSKLGHIGKQHNPSF